MRIKERRDGSTHILWYTAAAVFVASISPRPAAAVEVAAGDWKLTASGNVNVYYIHSSCEDQTTLGITGGLACRGAAGVTDTSSISNGLLPAALAIGASTTQKGLDLSVTFGFYPGISTNDGSPNLQQGAPLLNTALGTTAIDMRQVFMTFGNKQIGEFKLGRDIGLFGADAILNDMTLPGVGGGNGNYAAPANTSLGSIGLGYIYADWLGQINYTTPSFGGFKLTVGVFDPLEPITQGTPTPEGSPGYHAKVAFKADKFYLSASFISQKHEGPLNVGDFDSTGWDAGGKVTLAGLEVMGWYYSGKGMGTTALYLFGATALGQERDSDGFLAQVTYKFGDLKVGVNYGESNLDLASGEAPSDLVKKNDKYTGGVYYSLTENLTLIGEYSKIKAESHNGIKNESDNFNLGAYLSF
ncbi:porin [Steroidobacter flavus]|uniref:Porin n=1 Tax=Steroidobacter flavus TaxID=1842136 RepID=A0ABV8SZB2_9GAMM